MSPIKSPLIEHVHAIGVWAFKVGQVLRRYSDLDKMEVDPDFTAPVVIVRHRFTGRSANGRVVPMYGVVYVTTGVEADYAGYELTDHGVPE